MSSSGLPAGWAFATLPDLVGVGGLITDGDWVESKDQDENGSIRLTQLADVGDGWFRNRSQRFLRPDQAQRLGCTLLSEGDVLIARMPEPSLLVVAEDTAVVLLLGQPALEPRLHALDVRDQLAFLMECEAHERHHVRQEPAGRSTANLGLL